MSTDFTPEPHPRTANRLRLLVLTSTFPRWSGDREPRFVFDLCQRLSNRFEIHVLAPHACGAKRQEIINGIEITRFKYFFSRWETLAYEGGILAKLHLNSLRAGLIPLFILAQTLAALRIIKKNQIDIIHAHWIIPQGFIAVLIKLLLTKKIPIICSSHGSDLYGLSGWLLNKVKQWILDRCDAITVVSNAMEKALIPLGIDLNKVYVIPMGTDLYNVFCPSFHVKRKPATLLFVGRLVEKKGLNYLIEALPYINRTCPQIELIVAGTGPEEQKLRTLARELGVINKLKFLGAIPHEKLACLYQQATIAVIPSIDHEGFGLVIVEALGCKCPVIASDFPAIHDNIKDGETGLLVPPANAVILAARITNLLENPELRYSLARSGRAAVLAHFDWRNISLRYTNLLIRLVKHYK